MNSVLNKKYEGFIWVYVEYKRALLYRDISLSTKNETFIEVNGKYFQNENH